MIAFRCCKFAVRAAMVSLSTSARIVTRCTPPIVSCATTSYDAMNPSDCV